MFNTNEPQDAPAVEPSEARLAQLVDEPIVNGTAVARVFNGAWETITVKRFSDDLLTLEIARENPSYPYDYRNVASSVREIYDLLGGDYYGIHVDFDAIEWRSPQPTA